jgi:hypothetical protein
MTASPRSSNGGTHAGGELVGPFANGLSRSSHILSWVGALGSLALFGAFTAYEMWRGSVFLALLSLLIGFILVFYSIVVYVRLDGEPDSFSLSAKELVLQYNYLGFHKWVRIEWSLLRMRQENLRDYGVRLTTFQTSAFPRRATLDLDVESYRRAAGMIPKDIAPL